MVERSRVVFGLDYDGVLAKKPKDWDLLRRPTKMWLPPVPGVLQALDYMRSTYWDGLKGNFIEGVYTIRPKWLRGIQTRRQIARNGFKIDKVTHTNNSDKEKVRRFLLDTVAAKQYDGEFMRTKDGGYFADPYYRRAVLVDDSYDEIKKALDELGEESGMRMLLNRFAFFVFGKEQDQINVGKNYDPTMPRVGPLGIHVKWAARKDGTVDYAIPIIALPNWDVLPEAMQKLSDFKENPPRLTA